MATLLLLPSIGIAEDGGQKFYGRNLERLVADVADWSTPHSGLRNFRAIYKVLLCQTKPWRTPKTPHPDCRPMLYATGDPSELGYIQPDAAKEGELLRASPDWYQVFPEWNDRLWSKFRDQIPWVDETSIFAGPDVDKLIEEVAEWSHESDPPASYRKTGRFLFCQHQLEDPDAPPPAVESCFIAEFARGSVWKRGSIRIANADSGESKISSESWFPVNQKWNSMLDARLRRWEALGSHYPVTSTAEHPMPAYRGCWYGSGENRYVVACQ